MKNLPLGKWFFDRPRAHIAAGVGFLAAISLGWSLARTAVPGESAYLIALHSGLDPLTPHAFLVWGAIGNVLAAFLPGNPALIWNLFSAGCAVGSCILLCLLTTKVIGNKLDAEVITGHRNTYRHFAGFLAALLLAGSAPFRYAGSMALPITFHVLLVLLTLWWVVRYLETQRIAWLIAAMFLYGVTTTDYAVSLLGAPIALGVVAYAHWKYKGITARSLFLLCGAFVLGLIPAFIIAVLTLTGSEAPPFSDTLFLMAREHVHRLRFAAPRQGWLLLLLFTLPPLWMVLLFRKTRALASVFMITALGIVASFLFFHAPMTPWAMFGPSPLLLIPYVMGALWTGGLGALGLAFILERRPNESPDRPPPRLRSVLGGLFMVAILGLIGYAGAKNTNIHPRLSAPVATYADFIAHHLPTDATTPGTWLIADEPFASLIRIHASVHARHALILSPAQLSHAAYRRALCRDLNDPRLCSLLEIGILPLLSERSHPSRSDPPVMATLANPDLLRQAAGNAIPLRGLYLSQSESESDAEVLFAGHRETFDAMAPTLEGNDHGTSAYAAWLDAIRINLSRIANDTGVRLADLDRPDLAVRAYDDAISLYPDNLSAHLNRQQHIDPDSDAFTERGDVIEALSAPLRGRADLSHIIGRFGIIRHPRLEQDAPSIDDHRSRLDDEAAFYAVLNDWDTSHPGQPREGPAFAVTLLKAIRTPIAQGRIDLARRLLETIPESDLSLEVWSIERALLDLADGEHSLAYERLSALPVRDITDPRAFAVLALLSNQLEPAASDRYLERLETFPDLIPQFSLPLARLYIARENFRMAQEHIARLLRNDPNHIEALRLLIRLRLMEGNEDLMLPAIRTLLHLNVHDPAANEAWAIWLQQRGRTNEAEAARAVVWQTTKPEPGKEVDVRW